MTPDIHVSSIYDINGKPLKKGDSVLTHDGKGIVCFDKGVFWIRTEGGSSGFITGSDVEIIEAEEKLIRAIELKEDTA